jgi:hypothetical protein
MKLSKRFTETINPIPPYSFELTVRKPAGWPWLTPEEVYDEGVLWTATRIGAVIVGLKAEIHWNTEKTMHHLRYLFKGEIVEGTETDDRTKNTEILGCGRGYQLIPPSCKEGRDPERNHKETVRHARHGYGPVPVPSLSHHPSDGTYKEV